MYSGAGHSEWEIGDVEVIVDDKGKYHLFHLIIPNHDYIAHAVSNDGINWERTKNSLFVGDPGEWDDDMLWTMNVNSFEDGYEMFYTGLKLSDRGKVQKVGRAVSKDLLSWDKENLPGFPIGSVAPHYEDLANNPRQWLSFRDPFKFTYEGETYLLVCGRSANGPVSRRGCVSLYKYDDNGVESLSALLEPHIYDDIECPCIFEKNGKFYLIGSIREDIKVRYWFADEFRDEYRTFHANVLLPQGNYAARVIKDGEHLLVYSFYFLGGSVSTHRSLPPPKELDVDSEGRLVLKSFFRWKEKMITILDQDEFPEFKPLFGNKTAIVEQEEDLYFFESRSGYEIFAIDKPDENYVWEGDLKLEGLGKCGLVMDCDEEGNGYYISLDFVNGFVQFRVWGFNPDDVQNNFVFENIQTNQFKVNPNNSIRFKLIRYGNYIELSIDGIVKLTLVDYKYTGKKIGFYSASSVLSLGNSSISILNNDETIYGVSDEVANCDFTK